MREIAAGGKSLVIAAQHVGMGEEAINHAAEIAIRAVKCLI